jgi:hypothetical protein
MDNLLFELAPLQQLPNPKLLSEQMLQKAESGEVSPLLIKAIYSCFEQAAKKEKERIDELAMAEFVKVKDGTRGYVGADSLGAQVDLSSSSTTDYSECGDIILEELLSQMENIKAEIAARQQVLKSLKRQEERIHPETGEVFTVSPALVKRKEILKFSFK